MRRKVRFLTIYLFMFFVILFPSRDEIGIFSLSKFAKEIKDIQYCQCS